MAFIRQLIQDLLFQKMRGKRYGVWGLIFALLVKYVMRSMTSSPRRRPGRR